MDEALLLKGAFEAAPIGISFLAVKPLGRYLQSTLPFAG